MEKVNNGNPVFYQGKPCMSSLRLSEPLDTLPSLFYDCSALKGGGLRYHSCKENLFVV
jgi:hypothetical protein